MKDAIVREPAFSVRMQNGPKNAIATRVSEHRLPDDDFAQYAQASATYREMGTAHDPSRDDAY